MSDREPAGRCPAEEMDMPAAKRELVDIVTEMRDSPQWREALERNNWTDTFSTDTEFAQIIELEVARAQDIIEDLGQ